MHVLFQEQQDAALQNYPLCFNLTETLYVLRYFDSSTACGIIILFAGIRPCQFNFLFSGPDQPYYIADTKKKKKLIKRSKCNYNVDSHVISFLELYITLAKGLEIL